MLHELLYKIQKNLNCPKNQWNHFGKYNYRSCEDIVEAVKDLLEPNVSLLLSDKIVNIGNSNYIEATATLTDGKDSISVTGYAREALTVKGMGDSQITGATSSYARKYALNGLFAIDDTKDADTNEHKQDIDTRPEPTPEQKAQDFANNIMKQVEAATGRVQVDEIENKNKAHLERLKSYPAIHKAVQLCITNAKNGLVDVVVVE